MSWNSYIDVALRGSSNSDGDKVAIIGLNGSRWTTDDHASHFQMSDAEIAVIAKAMSSGDYGTFLEHGIHAGGLRFVGYHLAEGNVMGKSSHTESIIIQASKTAVVIGHTKVKDEEARFNKRIEYLVYYLETQNI